MKRAPFVSYADTVNRLRRGDVGILFADIFEGKVFLLNNQEFPGRWFHDHLQQRAEFAKSKIDESKSLKDEAFENLYVGLTEYINKDISTLYVAKATLNQASVDKRDESWKACLRAFDRLLAMAHISLRKLRFVDLVRQGLPENIVKRFQSLTDKIERLTDSMPDETWYGGERLPYFNWLKQFQVIICELEEIRREDTKSLLKDRLNTLEDGLQERKVEVVTIFSRVSELEQQRNEEEAENKLRAYSEELLKSIQGSYDRMHATANEGLSEKVAPFDPAFFSEESEILLKTFAADLGQKTINVTFEERVHEVLTNGYALRTRCLDLLAEEQTLLVAFILDVQHLKQKQEQCRANFITAFDEVKDTEEDPTTYFGLLQSYEAQLDEICGGYLPLANLRIEKHLDAQYFFEQRVEFKNEIKHARAYLDEWNARWTKIAALRDAGLSQDVRKRSMALQAWCAPDHHLTQGPFRRKIAHVLFLKYKDSFQHDVTDFALSYVKRLEEIRVEIEGMGTALTDAYVSKTNEPSLALVKMPARHEILALKNAFKADLRKRCDLNLISSDYAAVQELVFSTNCDLLVTMIDTCEVERKTLYANQENKRVLEQLQAGIQAKEERDKVEDQKIVEWKERAKSQDEELGRIKSQNQEEQDKIAQLEAMFAKKKFTQSIK